MRTGGDADAIAITFVMIDNRFTILQADGVSGAGLGAETATGTELFIDNKIHG